jgi:hypothetical protein
MIEAELSLNWVWTVDLDEGLSRLDEEDCDAFVKSEGDAFAVCDEQGKELLALACYHDGTTAVLSEDEAAYIHPKEMTPLLELDGRQLWLQPLCRLASISQALAEMVERDVGRHDVFFRFEPLIGPSPMLEEARGLADEASEALAAGDESHFEVMDLDNPAWHAEMFGMSLEEGSDQVKRIKEGASLLLAEHDQLVAARQERARKLYTRFAEQISPS